jgi:NO-binding membrane sensor protein with MHYT domain
MSKKEDISRSTILVLVFLAVIISVLGTWTVLDAVNDASRISQNQAKQQVLQEETGSVSTGFVSIGVIERDTEGDSNG